MDNLSPQQRSRLMARVRSKDTRPELQVRRGLWALGLRYRLYVKDLPGTPDLWSARAQVAVFVQGCFWHGHEGCLLYRLPKTRAEAWRAKVERNRERDERDKLRLLAAGFNVAVVWECALRMDAESCVRLLADFLRRELPPGSFQEISARDGRVVEKCELGRWDN